MPPFAKVAVFCVYAIIYKPVLEVNNNLFLTASTSWEQIFIYMSWKNEETKKQKDKERGARFRKLHPEYNSEYFKNHRKKIKNYWVKIGEKQLVKVKARSILNNALKLGKIKKLPCTVCGSVISEGHHPDYSKPLEVIWFCRIHHIKCHYG